MLNIFDFDDHDDDERDHLLSRVHVEETSLGDPEISTAIEILTRLQERTVREQMREAEQRLSTAPESGATV